jgi:anti-anti-sigma factor
MKRLALSGHTRAGRADARERWSGVQGGCPIMRVRAERAGPAVIVHLDGERLVVEEDTRPLHDLVRTLTRLDEGCSVILDLEKVSQLDCSGIGQIVQIAVQVHESGGVLLLVNVGCRQKRLLAMAGLLGVLPVLADQEEAVTACWSAKARILSALEGSTHTVRFPLESALQPAI